MFIYICEIESVVPGSQTVDVPVSFKFIFFHFLTDKDKVSGGHWGRNSLR